MDAVPFSESSPISSVCNWNTWTPPELANRAPFRPMIRTEAQLNGDEWTWAASSDADIVHFFNEPERAGISADKAAEAWKEKMLPLRKEKGKKIVSPSCASDPAGREWIHRWMELVCTEESGGPDFLGLHWYGTSADEFIKYLQGMHERYPDIPVIVSEFASVSRDRDEVMEFSAKAVNWMDETE